MLEISRRDFLIGIGLASSAAVIAGCAAPVVAPAADQALKARYGFNLTEIFTNYVTGDFSSRKAFLETVKKSGLPARTQDLVIWYADCVNDLGIEYYKQGMDYGAIPSLQEIDNVLSQKEKSAEQALKMFEKYQDTSLMFRLTRDKQFVKDVKTHLSVLSQKEPDADKLLNQTLNLPQYNVDKKESFKRMANKLLPKARLIMVYVVDDFISTTNDHTKIPDFFQGAINIIERISSLTEEQQRFILLLLRDEIRGSADFVGIDNNRLTNWINYAKFIVKKNNALLDAEGQLKKQELLVDCRDIVVKGNQLSNYKKLIELTRDPLTYENLIEKCAELLPKTGEKKDYARAIVLAQKIIWDGLKQNFQFNFEDDAKVANLFNTSPIVIRIKGGNQQGQEIVKEAVSTALDQTMDIDDLFMKIELLLGDNSPLKTALAIKNSIPNDIGWQGYHIYRLLIKTKNDEAIVRRYFSYFNPLIRPYLPLNEKVKRSLIFLSEDILENYLIDLKTIDDYKKAGLNSTENIFGSGIITIPLSNTFSMTDSQKGGLNNVVTAPLVFIGAEDRSLSWVDNSIYISQDMAVSLQKDAQLLLDQNYLLCDNTGQWQLRNLTKAEIGNSKNEQQLIANFKKSGLMRVIKANRLIDIKTEKTGDNDYLRRLTNMNSTSVFVLVTDQSGKVIENYFVTFPRYAMNDDNLKMVNQWIQSKTKGNIFIMAPDVGHSAIYYNQKGEPLTITPGIKSHWLVGFTPK